MNKPRGEERMSKLRIYEYAKKQNMSSKEVIEILKRIDITVTNHMGVMDQDMVQKVEKYIEGLKEGASKKKEAEKKTNKASSAKPISKANSAKPISKSSSAKPISKAKPETKPRTEMKRNQQTPGQRQNQTVDKGEKHL